MAAPAQAAPPQQIDPTNPDFGPNVTVFCFVKSATKKAATAMEYHGHAPLVRNRTYARNAAM